MHQLELVRKNDGDRKATLAKCYTMVDTMILSSAVAFVNLMPFQFFKEYALLVHLVLILPLFIIFALKNKYGHKHQVEDFFLYKMREPEVLVVFKEA